MKKLIQGLIIVSFLCILGTFALAQGKCSLSGRVVDEDKKPTPNARVYLYPLKEDENNPGLYSSAESDANGEFTIEFSNCSTNYTG